MKKQIITWIALVSMLAGTMMPCVPVYADQVQIAPEESEVSIVEDAYDIDDESPVIEQPTDRVSFEEPIQSLENTLNLKKTVDNAIDEEVITEAAEEPGDELLVESPCEDFRLDYSSIDLGEVISGCREILMPYKTVKFSYSGEGSGYLRSVSSESFDVTIENRFYNKDNPVDIRVEPKLNLSPGLYHETIRIESTTGEYCLLEVRLSVIAQDASFTILEPHDDVDFGMIRIGDDDLAEDRAESFTIKNTGNVPMSFSIYSPWAAVTPADDFNLNEGGTKTITVKPKTDGSVSGTFTVTVYGKPNTDYYSGSTTDEDIKCRDEVGYFLYGDVEAKDLVNGMAYELAENTVITIAAGDEKTIGRINKKADNATLTIKGSSSGELAINGFVIADGGLTITGGSLRVINGYIQSPKNIDISGGVVDIQNSWMGIYSTDSKVTISGDSKVTVSGGNRGIAGKVVDIKGNSVVFANTDDIGGSAIVGNSGVVIEGNVYVSAAANKTNGQGIFTTGNIQIKDNSLVHASGQYALLGAGAESKIVWDDTAYAVTSESAESVYYDEASYNTRFVDDDDRSRNIDDIVFRKKGTASVVITPVNKTFTTTEYGEMRPASRNIRLKTTVRLPRG